ncbi:molybdenum transport system permease protein ModB domain protein [Enterobacter hormaechei subsp. xiangfangensis]|nr:molybdenum transport system permease protein ModB domain protein [Enterobacter hormaechei subsp. xiangfangensis]
MGRRGFIGEWLRWFGLTFAFSWRGAVLAAAVMSFPLMGAPGSARSGFGGLAFARSGVASSLLG